MRRLLLVLLLLLAPVRAQPVVGQDSEVSVNSQDTLYSVARAHGLALEHLAFANGLPIGLRPLAPGKLLIPERRILPQDPPRDGLVLNLPERGLYLFQNGAFVRFYPVAIGKSGWETPVGDYTIASRVVDPTWVPPSWAGVSGPVGPGPDNPLGDRWMGLSRRGYGIHGTNQPDSVGGAVSHGCIRMYPELVRQLFQQVRVGMSVRIEYRPVKLARADSGQVLMVVFPDVYHRLDLLAESRSLIARAGLEELVEEGRLRQIVSHAEGVVRPLVGEEITLTLNGEAQPGQFLALRHRDRLYLPEEALAAVGLSLVESGGQLSVVHDEDRVEVSSPLKLDSRWFVPAADVLGSFGFQVKLVNGQLQVTRGRPA